MSAEDRNEGNDGERRELRKLAYEDADRTFAEIDPQRLSPKLPFDPPKLQWKDLVGDPEPKTAKDGVLDPKPPVPDPKQPWMEPKAPWTEPKQPWLEPKQPWRDPEPKSIIKDKGGFDPKQIFDPPKHLLDPKQPWQDPEPKPVFGDPGDPKHPKVDIDPDPKGILDPKNIYDPPKLAYDPWQFDPGRIFDPGRLVDPGAVARRPFVLGMPHHAPGAGAMAGAYPRAAMMRPTAEGAPDRTAMVEAALVEVERSMRMLKGDLEKLDDYYLELRDHLEELEAEEDRNADEGDTDATEGDGE